MGRLVSFVIHESDIEWTLRYTKRTLVEAFQPLIDKLGSQYDSEFTPPFCVALSGPPGCGKSAIAAIFKAMLSSVGIAVTVLPLDGFHMRNEELKKARIVRDGHSFSLYALKGAPECYATDYLKRCLVRLKSGERFYWPVYSRITHEPVDRGILIASSKGLYIIEGNYLLLQKEPWRGMRYLFDKAIFIHSRENLLKRRIISRKKRGGFSGMYARRQYMQSDRHNIDEVLTHSGTWDYRLLHTGRHGYEPG